MKETKTIECCENCKFYNKEKTSCSHLLWDRCVIRDDGYVIHYNYFTRKPWVIPTQLDY